jgi:hypothetical protein
MNAWQAERSAGAERLKTLDHQVAADAGSNLSSHRPRIIAYPVERNIARCCL